MDYKLILESVKDEHIKEFNSRIIPTKQKVYGIRIPELKKIAKQIASDDYKDFFKSNENEYFEETLLEGLVIGNLKLSFNDYLELIKNFVPKIGDWAQCDSSVASYKFINKNREEFLKFLQTYLNSDKEFEKRFGIVCLMDYYITDDYIDYVLNYLINIKSEFYYVNMAVAWALSVCFIKYYNKTLALFKNCDLDDFTYNKTISKCVESFRISEENKTFLKTLKRKSVK